MNGALIIRTVSLALGLCLLFVFAANAGSARKASSSMTPAQAKAAQLSTAKRLGIPLKTSNRWSMEFVLIPAGVFQMGSGESTAEVTRKCGCKPKYLPFEYPQHQVHISKLFYLQTTEVTHGQWKAVMGSNTGGFKGDDRLPVESVSWHDAQEFIRRLNRQEGGRKYRLPTEAEWEYACRAGTATPFSFGETISTDQANYDGDDIYGPGRKGLNRKQATMAGSLKPNNWGLYDMHGNVMEWCADWYSEGYYGSSPTQDPQGPSSGVRRVLRSGAYYYSPRLVRSAVRFKGDPAKRDVGIGFRVVRDN